MKYINVCYCLGKYPNLTYRGQEHNDEAGKHGYTVANSGK